MKVQCDVCEAEAATVFCCADEAALCGACDRRVHRANKLAGKHRRLSLLDPSPSSSSSPSSKSPLCDICQEKRGFLFCKEDRAILCRECDVKVHTVSELTRRHGRFLLTGVRVSSAPAETPAPSGLEEEENSTSRCDADDSCSGDASASASDGSSISEYLTKTLPGWHVEDFLLDDAAVDVSSNNKPYHQHREKSEADDQGVRIISSGEWRPPAPRYDDALTQKWPWEYLLAPATFGIPDLTRRRAARRVPGVGGPWAGDRWRGCRRG